jgi:nucleolar protein 58
LIAHAGSLLNLAKQPASTIQILGAEKALFRALKTKHDTPKYGLIYHASLIGQAAPKNKGKISRVLAAKTALAIRVDALGEGEGPTVAIDNRVKVEARIRQLEGGQMAQLAGAKGTPTPTKYDASAAKALAPPKFNSDSDVALSKKKKRSEEETNGHDDEEEKPKKKKRKDVAEDEDAEDSNGNGEKKKKKKKEKEAEEAVPEDDGEKKKKKKKKDKA